MPMHFDRFRLLNGGNRIRNDCEYEAFIKPTEDDPAVPVPPGGEIDLPFSPSGECIVEFPKD